MAPHMAPILPAPVLGPLSRVSWHWHYDWRMQKILIEIEGATPAQLDQAVSAVYQLFAAAGVSLAEAAQAAWDIEGWDMSGFPDESKPSVAAFDAAALWHQVHDCALDAAFGVDRPAGVRHRVDFRLLTP